MVVFVSLAASGCGGKKHAAAAPKPVPLSLVPASIDMGGDIGKLSVEEYKDARKQFAQAGTKSMVADGRLYEIRNGATLVATLQISTLQPKIDLTKKKQRETLLDILTKGGYSSIKVRGIDVATTEEAQKTSYVWFGRQLFELVQVKAPNVKPETLLRKILAAQKPTGELVIAPPGQASKS